MTAASSPSVMPASAARWADSPSPSPWWAWPSTPSPAGYWEVARDGGVFAFGGAPRLGSPSVSDVGDSVVGIASAPTGQGYWEVTDDGGVFSYGSATFHGSVVGGVAQRPGRWSCRVDRATGGYWLFSLDGGIFAFGAPFLGAG